MALNGSKQDEEGYLVWVETDQEGRILNRVRGRNWGKMNRKEFEKRDNLGESFERDDGLKVRISDIRNTEVEIVYQGPSKIKDYTRVFKCRKPWLKEEKKDTCSSLDRIMCQIVDELNMDAE